MIKKFNQWYDKLQEPWRFLFAMGLVIAGIIIVNIGSVTHSLKIQSVGFVYLGLLVAIRMAGRYNNATN